jgi:ribose transport system substrate-binding protein
MRLTKLLSGCAAAIAITLAVGSSAFADTFALVTINQQALFFNQINEGAQKAADAAGAKLVIFNANNVPSAQNDAMENYITQKVDGIILVAIDVNGVKPAITAAKAAGIPVIAIDAQIPDGDNVAFVGVDNTKAGEDIGKFYADYVKANMGGTAKIGVIGALNSFIQNQRLDGFKKAVADSGQKITFLDTVDGQNVQDVALTAAENLMTANPDMSTLYATGEPALVGAVSAVTSQGRTGDVKVFGWDLTKQAVEGIDAGWVTAVVQQDPAGEGKAAIEALTQLKKGEKVEPIINVPVTIVTKENVDQFRGMFK